MRTESDKLKELLEVRAQWEQEIEKLKTAMTILFSDIQGSTAVADQRGDAEYVSMIARHNSMLSPIIEAHGGRVVKTLGDAILAKFEESVGAIKAAAGMQRALAKDREGRDEGDQIRIRIGLHYGRGLPNDDDVLGDVVNAASRVQHHAEGDRILITDALLDATKSAGFECGKIGRFELKGKDEPVDLFAVAWSESAKKQLIDEVQARYERLFRERENRLKDLEEEFDSAREQWRNERRSMNAEIEKLEEAAERPSNWPGSSFRKIFSRSSVFSSKPLFGRASRSNTNSPPHGRISKPKERISKRRSRVCRLAFWTRWNARIILHAWQWLYAIRSRCVLPKPGGTGSCSGKVSESVLMPRLKG